MRHVIIATVCAVAVATAGCKPKDAVEHRAVAHGLAGWVARKVADEKKAKAEIEAMLSTMHKAYRDGDMSEAAWCIDFPVEMVTDDWKGEVLSAQWDRDTWQERMAPLFKNPVHEIQRTHKHDIFVISDSLANVDDEQTVHMGKSKVNIRSSSLVIRKEGRWLVKSVVESGWGDSQIIKPALGEHPEDASTAAGER